MILNLLYLLGAATPALASGPQLPPDQNVVVILIDDVGTDFLPMFDELNPYGGDPPDQGATPLYVDAPSLEALAAGGVTFLNAYSMPRCSPTRASLYTGHYPVRHGVGSLVDANHQGDLHEFNDPGYELPTLAQLAQSVGYADILVGKWHLGMPDALMDGEFGSDCYLGWPSIPLRGKWSEWKCTFRGVTSSPIPDPAAHGPPGYYNYYFSENETDHAQIVAQGPRTEYATVVQLDAALEWCNQQSGPFLCVISPNAAHSPWNEQPPEALVNTSGYLTEEVNAFTQQAAMIEALDTKIGEFIDGLGPGVLAKTNFIVLGDNGTPWTCVSHARLDGTNDGADGSAIDLGPVYDALLDAPENRFKRSVFEKGIRVPMIVAGPAVVDPGRTTRALVDVTDVYPTVGELIGADAGEVQGVSFVPVLQGDPLGARDFVYAESFEPLGSTDDEENFNERQIACSLRIPSLGRFKIVRDPSLGPDRFYRQETAEGFPVDPWELSPLPYGEGEPYYPHYQLVLQRLEAVLASGAGVGGTPCGHIERFCPALPCSTGVPGELHVDGSRSLCADDLRLRAVNLPPSQAGVFFYSDVEIELPFGDGVLCLGGQAVRLEVVQILPNGKVYYPFDVGAAGFGAGEVWGFQFWFRDPLGAGGSGFNFTDALSLQFCP